MNDSTICRTNVHRGIRTEGKAVKEAKKTKEGATVQNVLTAKREHIRDHQRKKKDKTVEKEKLIKKTKNNIHKQKSSYEHRILIELLHCSIIRF